MTYDVQNLSPPMRLLRLVQLLYDECRLTGREPGLLTLALRVLLVSSLVDDLTNSVKLCPCLSISIEENG